MRIIIEIPDDLGRASRPSVTEVPEPSAIDSASMSDAISGGEAAPSARGVAKPLDEDSSAGAAMEGTELEATDADAEGNDGGAAPD